MVTLSKEVLARFKSLVGEGDYWDQPTDLALYSFDSSVENPVMPQVVVRPQTTAQVAEIAKLCSEHSVQLITRGSGTNLAGSTIPVSGGCVLLMTKMNKVLEINVDDMYAVVQAGAITLDVAEAVQKTGLFYPPDPGSQKMSTIGGNIAENAGGLRGLKYGVTKDYVMGVTFVDMQGNVVKAGGKTVKLCTGFNLTGLMIQSEGQLGIITECVLKIVPPPKAAKSMLVSFQNILDAGNTVSDIIRAHVLHATLELHPLRPLQAGLPVGRANRPDLPQGQEYPAPGQSAAGVAEAGLEGCHGPSQTARHDESAVPPRPATCDQEGGRRRI
jgi:glycolate oxidase